jgi:signal transduction histidine kinase
MALVADPEHGSAWRTAARTLDAGSAAPGLAGAVARVLDAARPGAGAMAGEVVARLLTATAEVTRGDLLAGMHTRGHRLKNLLGIVGSRTRSARKLAGEHAVGDRLRELETQLTGLYDEWAAYLRSMQAAGPSLEVVSVLPLLSEVIAAASAEGRPPVRLSVPSGLPDLRGDRMLLREALLNLITNAVDACVATGGQVDVAVRVQSGRGAPIVEIEVADSGSGIPRADLARIFAPGFTTKENGSGVGLTIAERVIVAHHGRILIDSEVGRGTRITVLLPADLGGFAALGLAPPPPGADER